MDGAGFPRAVDFDVLVEGTLESGLRLGFLVAGLSVLTSLAEALVVFAFAGRRVERF